MSGSVGGGGMSSSEASPSRPNADPCRAIELVYRQLALGEASPRLPKVRAYMMRNRPPATPSTEQWRSLVQARWPEMFDEFSYARN